MMASPLRALHAGRDRIALFIISFSFFLFTFYFLPFLSFPDAHHEVCRNRQSFEDTWSHLVIFRTQDVIFLLIGRCLNASQIQQEMRQGIGHEALVLSLAYLTVDIAVVPDIFWRTVYPERNFKLIVSQRPVDFCRMVTADEATVLFVAFLAMVGHVDDDGILLLETLHNLGYDRVVVG